MVSPPLITIGITCYNAAETIERAIRSALAQTWPNFEILVVDDASVDQSVAQVQAHFAGDPCLRIITCTQNAGVAAARNRIVEEARGEFIAFFDDDDESRPNRLANQYQRITGYERATDTERVICHSARTQVLPNRVKVYAPTLGTQASGAVPHGPPVADQMLIGRPLAEPVAACATCSQMARTAIYRQLDGFNANLRRNEDTDFNVRFALAGGHFAGIAEPLVTQYMTFTAEKQMEEERRFALRWLDNHRTYLESIGWYRHAREWLDIKFDYLCGRRARFVSRLLLLLIKSPHRTLQRLLWAWPNRRHSRLVSDWHLEYHDAD